MANLTQADIDAIKSSVDIGDTIQNEQIQSAFEKVLLDLNGSSPSYTTYVALLSQSGTGNPIATVLENTLGATITWVRDAAGTYKGNVSADVLTVGQTTATITANVVGLGTVATPFIETTGTSKLTIYSYMSDGTLLDDQLSNFGSLCVVEIRVYN